MEQRNYDRLTGLLEKLGFSDTLNKRVEKAMKDGVPSFDERTKRKEGDSLVLYTLRFAKSEKIPGQDSNIKEPWYFLNNILALRNPISTKPQLHDFRIINGNGYNQVEMFNMMQGRYVAQDYVKDSIDKEVWAAINFDKKDQYGNNELDKIFLVKGQFDIARELSKMPVGNIPAKDLAILVQQIRMGGRVKVDGISDSGTQELFLQALPGSQILQAYNASGGKVMFTDKKLSLMTDDEFKKLPDITRQLLNTQLQKAEQGQEQQQGARQKRA